MPNKPFSLEDFLWFLTSPDIDPSCAHREDRYSTLYLLRREIQECLLDDGTALQPEAEAIRSLTSSLESAKPPRRAFASTMLMLAGIDLLGKFAAGNDGGSVEKRFLNFAQKYMGLESRPDADTLYEVRNALMHSFGLYVKGKDKQLQLVLGAPTDPIVSQPAEFYQVNILALYRALVFAIRQYETDVRGDTGLQEKFQQMFNRYGFILIQS